MSEEDIFKITSQNSNDFLNKKGTLDDLRHIMKEMLLHMRATGELERYWKTVEKDNLKAQRRAVKEY